MSSLFNYNNFSDINYLNFEPNFDIKVEDKIKIILGPNGTGKTSIYNNIKDRFSDYSYIDYDDVEKSFISNNKKIIIGASILELEKKYNEKLDIIENINVKNNLKEFDITSNVKAREISRTLEKYRQNEEISILKFDDDKLSSLFELNEKQLSFYNKNIKQFIGLENVKSELKDIKENYKRHFLEEVEKYIDDDEKICPVCGLENSKPIKEIISEKLASIKIIEEEIINNYQEMFPDSKAEEVLNNVNGIKSVIDENKIEIENIEMYLLCGGNKEKVQEIIEAKEKIKLLNSEIENLEQEKEEFYNNLIKHKASLISTFNYQFSVKKESIHFDDLNKLIEIELDRKIETYSTGEINLMTFIVCILEFISSDKEYMIIDDPLSSYDIPNQYRIMYEIASTKKINKKILIFTHNVDTINIANSQYNAIFEYEVIEKIKNTLYLNTIDYYNSDNILCMEEIINHIDNSYGYKDYLVLLNKKDNWSETDDNHLIFHYDSPFSKCIEGVNYSNDVLANLIDTFDENSFNNISYVENTADKIIYMSALRVWIEKQFYINIGNDSTLHNKTFGEKVNYIFSGNHWNGSSEVTKEFLMSKKVMLNNHMHSKSQRLPFYYVLNLTYNDIINEIKDIKAHFDN